ncbi:hypothetical protein D5086_027959 [Populus alba]|uniref:Uncharacterized protein n=2 Tax=Populus alba TaxID=43335 RepID=A0A4U5QLV4_POPAL|nr:hypothetical protein D5086_0000074840 [Populus alba]
MTGHWVKKWKQSSTIKPKGQDSDTSSEPQKQQQQKPIPMSFGPHQLLYRANITYSHAHHTIISTFHPSLSQSRTSKFSPSAIMHHKRNENNSPVQQFAFMCLSNGCKVNIYLILRRTCFTVLLPFHQVNLSSYRLSVYFFS